MTLNFVFKFKLQYTDRGKVLSSFPSKKRDCFPSLTAVEDPIRK